MIRREVAALIVGLALGSLSAHASEPAVPVVGFLSSGSPASFGNFVAAFRQGLSDEGYAEGSTVRIDYRWAQGRYNDLDALAAGLVHDRVDLIAATGGVVSAKAALKATASIPIVFVVGFDPVGLGLVQSLNKPGGNATGISIFTTELIAKRVQLLYELSPGISKVAILVNAKAVVTDIEIQETIAAIKRSGRSLLTLSATTESEIDAAFAAAAEQKAGGLIVSADPYFTSRRAQVVGLATRYAIPAIYPVRQYADAGGLMSYGPNLERAYRDSGNYAGRILKGADPKTLPVELPTTFNLVINLKAAKALGLNISPLLLAIANDVIE
ncbi:MAG TPA: ABC transporter substrate-binding protein [Stellaceae bacterium]|nr:ABC transporter substrate-binding protein [Stellaceae bacterium]